jgi:hypothetical protein
MTWTEKATGSAANRGLITFPRSRPPDPRGAPQGIPFADGGLRTPAVASGWTLLCKAPT